MASPLPVLDLNLLPSGALLTPKIEPKLEPPDELPLLLPPPPGFTPSPESPVSSVLPADDSDIYDEFVRVSELFSAAFAHNMHRCRTAAPPPPPLGTDTSQRSVVPVPAATDTAVSAYAPPIGKEKRARSSEMVRVTAMTAGQERYFRDLVRRTRIMYESLRIFICQLEERGGAETILGLPVKSRRRADLKAASVMKDRGMWLNRDQRIVGPIPGIYVGDQFLYRIEMCVVGLHGQIQAGIDFVGSGRTSNGDPIATSIIVSGGYEDDEDSGDVIIYTGHGGKAKNNATQTGDQKLTGGNLGLERSRHYGIEIRVIRGIKCDRSPTGKVYIYDGLYKVVDYWFDRGKSGFGVYKYKLVRMPEQPEMGTVIFKFAEELKTRPLVVRPKGYLSMDVSQKKERLPVYLFNDVDSDYGPMCFQYAASPVYPPFAFAGSGYGCDCLSSCGTSCKCIQMNGGEPVYNGNGVLMRGRLVIYECGKSCRCPLNCSNRVSQRGLNHRLEVFRSRETSWGVRSLDLIRAGEYICEYSGIFLTGDQAAVLSMNGESSLIHPNRFPSRWKEWGNLTPVVPDIENAHVPYLPPLDFAIDVSRVRNVACYISHSCSPNVMVQVVAYSHGNLLFPHLVLFSMENIPPLREMSIDYGVADGFTPQVLCIDNKPSNADLV